jgi:hypothetical protein
MHATQVATPFHRPGWVYEEKVDGYRIAALKTREAVNLISRNGIHHAKRFLELFSNWATADWEIPSSRASRPCVHARRRTRFSLSVSPFIALIEDEDSGRGEKNGEERY